MIDFTFRFGNFNATSVAIFPKTDKGRAFFKVNASVHSFTVRKSAMIEILDKAERESVDFMDSLVEKIEE